MAIAIERDVYPKTSKLVALYDSVGWKKYTEDEGALTRAIVNSLAVVTAWADEEHLVGLARAVGDGETVIYIQDVLVHPDYQKNGIGHALVEQLSAMYPTVQQKLLLADDTQELHDFYIHAGFVPVDEQGMKAWIIK